MSDDEMDHLEEEEEEENELDEEFEEEEEEQEEERDMFPDDEPPKSTLKRTKSYEVIPHDSILKDSKKLIDDIVQVCGIPTAAAATILLRHFRFRSLTLLIKFIVLTIIFKVEQRKTYRSVHGRSREDIQSCWHVNT